MRRLQIHTYQKYGRNAENAAGAHLKLHLRNRTSINQWGPNEFSPCWAPPPAPAHTLFNDERDYLGNLRNFKETLRFLPSFQIPTRKPLLIHLIGGIQPKLLLAEYLQV